MAAIEDATSATTADATSATTADAANNNLICWLIQYASILNLIVAKEGNPLKACWYELENIKYIFNGCCVESIAVLFNIDKKTPIFIISSQKKVYVAELLTDFTEGTKLPQEKPRRKIIKGTILIDERGEKGIVEKIEKNSFGTEYTIYFNTSRFRQKINSEMVADYFHFIMK